MTIKVNTGGHHISRLLLLLLLCTAAAVPTFAQGFSTIFYFTGPKGSDGDSPHGPLVQGFDGNFYGTTQFGGTNDRGTIFNITASGIETALYSFPAGGPSPQHGLILGTDGNFYGITIPNNTPSGGTVFKVTPSGDLTTIYTFCPQTNCGGQPSSPVGLVEGFDGNFYGTTSGGGGSPNNYGTIFKLAPDGTLTTLYNFCSQPQCADGYGLATGLVQGWDGDFYGTTLLGGSSGSGECPAGCGTIFKITPAGAFTILHVFCEVTNCPDGAGVHEELIQATDGNFYGTTEIYGGNNSGTAFKVTPQGTFTTIYTFCSRPNCTDGHNPNAGLVQATDGNFYGVGGETVFKLAPSGTLTAIHNLRGNEVRNGMFEATNGTLYGTTITLNPNGNSTVYKLNTRFAPFVKTVPTSGTVGSAVAILGTDLTGATAVEFNGIAAKFTLVSATQITATVPDGATTGAVMLTVSNKVLSSNVQFQVQ